MHTGEVGRGFAVVADEVQKTTIERVRNDSQIAGELDGSFKEVEDGSQTVARLISEITSPTNEQAQGVHQVNTAVAQMDKVTQTSAATAGETAFAPEELSAQAAALNGMIEDLISMAEGGAVPGISPRAMSMRVGQVYSSGVASHSSPGKQVKISPPWK